MIALKLDTQGTHAVRWPLTDPEVIALAKHYLEREKALPADQQLKAPSLNRIEELCDVAGAAMEKARDFDIDRSVAAQDYHRAVADAREPLEQAIKALEARYFKNLAQLKEWGLEVFTSRGRLKLRRPVEESAWMAFLQAYVAKESALEPASRIADPPLEILEPLAKKAADALKRRDQSTNERISGVNTRSDTVAPLLDHLQVAGVMLVLERFKGKVTPDLSAWGFDVVKWQPAEPEKPATDGTAQGEASKQAAGSTSAQADASAGAANGSAQAGAPKDAAQTPAGETASSASVP